ncbi:IclR family transcriptional regulator [Dactylosporangium sp. NPDC005572]|uniref:IclR family transcriptional regulator n=1 Tax=Dactylosporangium sp. NPDC005572 TaxID=3156889 RepID=UPI0033B45665
MNERENGDIQVIARCAQILRQFEPGSRLRLGPLASELGVGRSTLHRYLASMVNADFLERVGEGEYTLGPLLAQLGTMALNSLHVIEAAGPTMRDLCQQTQETVVLSVWGGLGPVVTRVETPDKLIQVLVRIGSQLPIDAAQTRLFLAFLRDRRTVEKILLLVPDRRAELERGMESARREGVVIVSGYVLGLRTAAVPVLDARGIAASMAIVGTEAAIPDDTSAGLVQGLRRAAEELSRKLGFSGDYPGSMQE